MGIIIGRMEAQTMNDKWKPEFIADKEITNKQFTIKDFAVYMNVSNNPKDVLFDDLTRSWTEEVDYDAKCKRFLL